MYKGFTQGPIRVESTNNTILGALGGTNLRVRLASGYASGEAQVLKSGEFAASSVDWAGYPEGQFGLTRPGGPFRLISGEEYAQALAAKKAINASITQELPLWRSSGLEWHEITPIKFGGSPTDLANKIPLPASFHRSQVTPWWNRLQRSLQGGQ